MLKFDKVIEKDTAGTSENNISFYLSNPTIFNEENLNCTKEKKISKIFNIFHKAELIYNEQKTSQKDENSKIFYSIQYKCFYCKKKYNNLNIFEAHMRIHVS